MSNPEEVLDYLRENTVPATVKFPVRWCLQHGFGSTTHAVSPCEYFEELDEGPDPDEPPCQYVNATLKYHTTAHLLGDDQ